MHRAWQSLHPDRGLCCAVRVACLAALCSVSAAQFQLTALLGASSGQAATKERCTLCLHWTVSMMQSETGDTLFQYSMLTIVSSYHFCCRSQTAVSGSMRHCDVEAGQYMLSRKHAAFESCRSFISDQVQSGGSSDYCSLITFNNEVRLWTGYPYPFSHEGHDQFRTPRGEKLQAMLWHSLLCRPCSGNPHLGIHEQIGSTASGGVSH